MAKKKSISEWMTHNTVQIAIFAVFVGFIVGLYISFFFLESDWKPVISYSDEHDHDHDDPAAHAEDASHDSMDHAHDGFMYMGDSPPSVLIDVTQDTKSGYNLELITENFNFNPAASGSSHIDGEGHAHLYINGDKITRVYSNYYYLGDFEPGTYQISVTLNTNDHQDYMVDGSIVSDEFLLELE